MSQLSNSSALDSAQQARIEHLHRGFLFQHLYAVACLLGGTNESFDTLRSEGDEDIELVNAKEWVYLQVKTRQSKLQPSDVQESLDRFEVLSRAHADGERPGKPRFGIVANVSCGPKLTKILRKRSIEYVGPGTPAQWSLPVPCPDVGMMLSACNVLADRVPYSALSPSTLVFKLASIVQAASAGLLPNGHDINLLDFGALCEQVVEQLHTFPPPPRTYVPQDAEPAFCIGQPARLVLGHSGWGKTAWAAELAMHSENPVVYYDVAGSPGDFLVAGLAREVYARISAPDTVQLWAGKRPLDTLRLLNRHLVRRRTTVSVVVDNAHLSTVDELRSILGVTGGLQWLLLAHPTTEIRTLAALAGISGERLAGWSPDTVAGLFAQEGCPLRPEEAVRARALTQGAPLFVSSLISVVRDTFNGDATRALDQFERNTHVEELAQELVLDAVLGECHDDERAISALLALIQYPLADQELAQIARRSKWPAAERVPQTLRSLLASGVARAVGDGRYQCADAFRLSAAKIVDQLRPGLKSRAQGAMLELLSDELARGFESPRRLAAYLELLSDLGRGRELADVVQGVMEWMVELGLRPSVLAAIQDVTEDDGVDGSDRFWALDTLCFFALQDDDLARAGEILQRMKDFASTGSREGAAFHIKRILYYGRRRDFAGVSRSYRLAGPLVEAKWKAILEYDYAVACWHCGRMRPASIAAARASKLAYASLGLSPTLIFGKNPEDIRPLLDVDSTPDDLRHLADSLFLVGQIHLRQGSTPIFDFIHALKFYDMANAPRSAIRACVAFVEQLLLPPANPRFAREFMETTVLPTLARTGLSSYVVEVGLLNLRVLLQNRDQAAARRQLTALMPYGDALSTEEQIVYDECRAQLEGHLVDPP